MENKIKKVESLQLGGIDIGVLRESALPKYFCCFIFRMCLSGYNLEAKLPLNRSS